MLETIQTNLKTIHTYTVQSYLDNRQRNSTLAQISPSINKTEESLPRKTRRTLAQLRAGKSPFLTTCLYKINPTKHTSPLCPLCNANNHDTTHLFICTHIHTNLKPLDLWNNPIAAADLLHQWEVTLGGGGSGPWPTLGLWWGRTHTHIRTFSLY